MFLRRGLSFFHLMSLTSLILWGTGCSMSSSDEEPLPPPPAAAEKQAEGGPQPPQTPPGGETPSPTQAALAKDTQQFEAAAMELTSLSNTIEEKFRSTWAPSLMKDFQKFKSDRYNSLGLDFSDLKENFKKQAQKVQDLDSKIKQTHAKLSQESLSAKDKAALQKAEQTLQAQREALRAPLEKAEQQLQAVETGLALFDQLDEEKNTFTNTKWEIQRWTKNHQEVAEAVSGGTLEQQLRLIQEPPGLQTWKLAKAQTTKQDLLESQSSLQTLSQQLSEQLSQQGILAESTPLPLQEEQKKDQQTIQALFESNGDFDQAVKARQDTQGLFETLKQQAQEKQAHLPKGALPTYSLHLMWIFESPQTDQQAPFLFPQSQSEKHRSLPSPAFPLPSYSSLKNLGHPSETTNYPEACIQNLIAWSDQNPTASLYLWYDSKTASPSALERTTKAFEAQKKGLLGSKLFIRDIQELETVKTNADVFSEEKKLPLAFRTGLLSFILTQEFQKGDTSPTYAIYSDLDFPPIPAHQLFDPETNEKLNLFSFVFGYFPAYERLVPEFHILGKGKETQEAFQAVLIDFQLARAKKALEKGLILNTNGRGEHKPFEPLKISILQSFSKFAFYWYEKMGMGTLSPTKEKLFSHWGLELVSSNFSRNGTLTLQREHETWKKLVALEAFDPIEKKFLEEDPDRWWWPLLPRKSVFKAVSSQARDFSYTD